MALKQSRVMACLPPHILPKIFEPAAFIAGGYAACAELATDIDVWVEAKDITDARRTMLNHLIAYDFMFVEEPGVEEFTGDTLGYEDITANIAKVALVWAHGFKPVHLLVTDAPPLMLLLNFDISTHAIALTGDGIIRSPFWTPLDVAPEVIKNHGTSKTEERLKKISARYAHLRRDQ